MIFPQQWMNLHPPYFSLNHLMKLLTILGLSVLFFRPLAHHKRMLLYHSINNFQKDSRMNWELICRLSVVVLVSIAAIILFFSLNFDLF